MEFFQKSQLFNIYFGIVAIKYIFNFIYNFYFTKNGNESKNTENNELKIKIRFIFCNTPIHNNFGNENHFHINKGMFKFLSSSIIIISMDDILDAFNQSY